MAQSFGLPPPGTNPFMKGHQHQNQNQNPFIRAGEPSHVHTIITNPSPSPPPGMFSPKTLSQADPIV